MADLYTTIYMHSFAYDQECVDNIIMVQNITVTIIMQKLDCVIYDTNHLIKILVQ